MNETDTLLRFDSQQNKKYYIFTAEALNNARFAFYCVLVPITSLFGIVGNICSFAVLKQKALRSTQTLVLLALTIADTAHLFVSLLFCFLYIAKYFHPHDVTNANTLIYPYFGSYFYHLFGRISAMLIVVISIERLIVVIAPLQAKIWWSKKVMIICIIISYLFPSCIMIPQILEYESHTIFNPNSTDYTYTLTLTNLGMDRSFYMHMYNVNMATLRYIPTLIVIITNLAIIVGLWHHTLQRKKLDASVVCKMSLRDLQITRTILSISIFFFISSTPGTTVFMIQNLDPDYNYPFFRNNAYIMTLIISYWLEVLSSSINFVIYIASNSRFRQTFKDMCACCLKKPPLGLYAQRIESTGSRLNSAQVTRTESQDISH